jgi:hypothetical protein
MIRHAFVVSVSLVLTVLSLAAQVPPTDSKSGVRARIVGAWALVSTEEHMTDGSKRPYLDVGASGKGYLIYTADGHMCAAGMNPDRPAWLDVNNPTREEKLRAMEGFFGYCGRYEIDAVTHVIYHYPEVALDPNTVGTTQPRPYSFGGETLTFSDKDTAPGVVSYAISWKKMKRR